VPRLPQMWLPRLAELFGTTAFVIGRRARQTAQANIQPVLGQGRHLGHVHRMFVHNAQYYLSLFACRPADFNLADHELNGWQHFREALDMGRGCLLVSPHLGDINYYAELFVAAGLGVNVLVEDLRPKEMSDLVVRLRERRGVNVIVGGPGALRQVYRALYRNEIVAVISDRDLTGDGQPVTFFGRESRMPATAFTIATRRKTPIVFGTAVRLDDGHIVTDVRKPFVPCGEARTEVQQMAGVFEEFIRRWPDQWLAFQPIWGLGSGVSGLVHHTPNPKRQKRGRRG
jgi:phosphatidylinositol dimannoside acyltransferase